MICKVGEDSGGFGKLHISEFTGGYGKCWKYFEIKSTGKIFSYTMLCAFYFVLKKLKTKIC